MKWNKLKKLVLMTIPIIICCYLLGFVFNCYVSNNYVFKFNILLLFNTQTYIYTFVLLAACLLLYLMYYHKHYWLKNSNKIIKGNKRDSDIIVNLEQARFQTENEIIKNFEYINYNQLCKYQAGIPIRAEQKGNKYYITLAKNTHCLIIGTTGSGKTTTFINPTIQILSETKDKPSIIISDPKGELFMLHAKSLEKKGYTIKVIDLRNPFNSIKWNPLEKPFLSYQRMLNLKDEIIEDDENGLYFFENISYTNEEIDSVIKVKQQQLFDEIYEDLNDIMTVLCPITNKSEPIWESGAKNLVLAIALAMLEDSANDKLKLTVDKYNFYNIAKLATNTDNDCKVLLEYFNYRNPISRAVSLSKQVLETAEKTRGSYLSTLFDKLNMFADLSLCSLTSENEITFSNFDEKPTALFLQIPDERETRHSLASMVILQAYKELVRKANSYSDLCLARPVYFLLDEFGNLPAIHKLETMITVGRSRNIWLNLVVQSYAQLGKVYDEKTAEIIKSNCNIQNFIGTTDQKTVDDFSKRCGNFTVITRSLGYNTVKADDINSNVSLKERPLIYPSELQQLNNSSNMGNAIVTVFGFQPIKAKFTPSFKVKRFKFEKSKDQIRSAKFFDEQKLYYDIKNRNSLLRPKKNAKRKGIPIAEKSIEINHEQIITMCERSLIEVLTSDEFKTLFTFLEKKMYLEALKVIEIARIRAGDLCLDHLLETLEKLIKKVGAAALLQNELMN